MTSRFKDVYFADLSHWIVPLLKSTAAINLLDILTNRFSEMLFYPVYYFVRTAYEKFSEIECLKFIPNSNQTLGFALLREMIWALKQRLTYSRWRVNVALRVWPVPSGTRKDITVIRKESNRSDMSFPHQASFYMLRTSAGPGPLKKNLSFTGPQFKGSKCNCTPKNINNLKSA